MANKRKKKSEDITSSRYRRLRDTFFETTITVGSTSGLFGWNDLLSLGASSKVRFRDKVIQGIYANATSMNFYLGNTYEPDLVSGDTFEVVLDGLHKATLIFTGYPFIRLTSANDASDYLISKNVGDEVSVTLTQTNI